MSPGINRLVSAFGDNVADVVRRQAGVVADSGTTTTRQVKTMSNSNSTPAWHEALLPVEDGERKVLLNISGSTAHQVDTLLEEHARMRLGGFNLSSRESLTRMTVTTRRRELLNTALLEYMVAPWGEKAGKKMGSMSEAQNSLSVPRLTTNCILSSCSDEGGGTVNQMRSSSRPATAQSVRQKRVGGTATPSKVEASSAQDLMAYLSDL